MRMRFVVFITLFVLAALSFTKDAQGIQGEWLRARLDTQSCYGRDVATTTIGGSLEFALRSQERGVFIIDLAVDGVPYGENMQFCIEGIGCGTPVIVIVEEQDRGLHLAEWSLYTDTSPSGVLSVTIKYLVNNMNQDRWYSAEIPAVLSVDFCDGVWTSTPTSTPTPTRRPSKTPTETMTPSPTVTLALTATPTSTPTSTPDRKYRIWYFPLVWK